MVVPNNHGVFLPKIIILGCEMGVPPFKETPTGGGNGHPSISASLFPVAQLHLLPQWAAIEADCTWEGLIFFLSHGSTRMGGQKFQSF